MATARKSGTRRNESTFLEAAAIVLMIFSVEMTAALTLLDDTTANSIMVTTSHKGPVSDDTLNTDNKQHPAIASQDDLQNTLKGTHFLVHQRSDHARRNLVEFSRSFVSLEFIDERLPNKPKSSKENYTNVPLTSSFFLSIRTMAVNASVEVHAHPSSVVRRSAEQSICAPAQSTSLCECSGANVTCDDRSLPPLSPREHLPDSFRHFSAVRSNLTAIPAFAKPTSVVTLRLRSNEIQTANVAVLANYPELVELDLSGNKLEELDLSGLELPRLSVLHASSNHLRTFASQPFTLSSLFLDRNQLSDISFVSTFTSLEILNLSHNLISNIYLKTFQNSTKLRVLQLHNNKIVSTDFLEYVTNDLQTLHMSNNRILKMSALSKSKVISLYLANNLLRNIDFFADLRNVAELDVSDNKLLRLNKNIFVNKIKLKNMDAAGTNISSIEFVLTIPSLVGLGVEENNITCLPLQLFTRYKSLRTLYLGSNPTKNLFCVASPWFFNKVAKTCNVSYNVSGEIVEIHMRHERVDDYFNCILQRYPHFLRNCTQNCVSGVKRILCSYFLIIIVLINFM